MVSESGAISGPQPRAAGAVVAGMGQHAGHNFFALRRYSGAVDANRACMAAFLPRSLPSYKAFREPNAIIFLTT